MQILQDKFVGDVCCGRVLGFCISPVLVLKHSDTTEKN